MDFFQQLIQDATNLMHVNWLTDTAEVSGADAPIFTWAGVAALVSLFLFHAARLCVAAWSTSMELNRLNKAVGTSSAASPVLTSTALETLSESFAKSLLIGPQWSEFRETLLTEQSADGRLVFNTRAAQEFFTEESTIHTHVKLDFYRSFPGVLTGIGLLFTFLAILIGLNGVVVASPAGDMQISQVGMMHLVRGLSG